MMFSAVTQSEVTNLHVSYVHTLVEIEFVRFVSSDKQCLLDSGREQQAEDW